jgi:hypothetical protein
MKNKSLLGLLLIASIGGLIGCVSTVPLISIPSRQIDTQKITLGNVQKTVKKGATNSEVVAALSSPNIVTSNPDGTETWVYDKVMSEAEYAQGLNGAVAVQSTRTLIVVIKFDKASAVESVQYRQTSY